MSNPLGPNKGHYAPKLAEQNRKGRVRRPTPNQAQASPVVAVRFGKELKLWIEKAAHVELRDFPSFVRYACRKEADRILGYDRGYRRTQKPVRPDLEREEATIERNKAKHPGPWATKPTTEDK